MTNLLSYLLTMIRANIHEVKARLSEFLEQVERGETVVICRRNIPVAEIRGVAATMGPRPVGIDPGLRVPASFFDPLPDPLVAAFEGREGS